MCMDVYRTWRGPLQESSIKRSLYKTHLGKLNLPGPLIGLQAVCHGVRSATREDDDAKPQRAQLSGAAHRRLAALDHVLAVVSQRTNLAARPRFDGWAR